MDDLIGLEASWAQYDPVEITMKLVKEPTYGEALGVEAPAIRYLQTRFDQLGIPYRIFEENGQPYNLVAEVGQGERTIILNGHLDVVPAGDLSKWGRPPFEPSVHDGQLHGRGSCDAKGPLAAMVAAFERLWQHRDQLQGRVTLLAVGAEETGGTGIKRAIKAGIHADVAIVGEPTQLTPHIAHKGRMTIEVTTRGKPAHASNPEAGINAITKMAGLVPDFDALHAVARKVTHPLLGSASSTVTRIRGGVAVNVVPGECVMLIDRRLIPGETPDQALAAYQAVVERARQADPELDVEVKLLEAQGPAETKSSEWVAVMEDVVSQVLGRRIRSQGFTATCDMTHLENEGSTPTIIFGPGDLGLAHQYNESVPVAELYVAAQVYYQACLSWTGTRL